MNRTLAKGMRDLIVVAVGAVARHLFENISALDIPVEYAPIISTMALSVHRMTRDFLQGQYS